MPPLSIVITGFVPVIHASLRSRPGHVDGRNKSGHDGFRGAKIYYGFRGAKICEYALRQRSPSKRPAVDQLRHETVDLLRQARLGERGADQAAGALELDAFGQFNRRGNLLGPSGSFGEREMQLLPGIKARDWKIENDLVKIARAELPARLELFRSRSRDFAVEDRRQVTRFGFR